MRVTDLNDQIEKNKADLIKLNEFKERTRNERAKEYFNSLFASDMNNLFLTTFQSQKHNFDYSFEYLESFMDFSKTSPSSGGGFQSLIEHHAFVNLKMLNKPIKAHIRFLDGQIDKVVFSAEMKYYDVEFELTAEKINEYIELDRKKSSHLVNSIHFLNFKNIIKFLGDNKISSDFSFLIHVKSIQVDRIDIEITHTSYWNQAKYFFRRMFVR